MLALPLGFREVRFAASLRAAPSLARPTALAFRLGRFVDFLAVLLALDFAVPFPLRRAAAFFRVAFFFAAMDRLVSLILFLLPESRPSEPVFWLAGEQDGAHGVERFEAEALV